MQIMIYTGVIINTYIEVNIMGEIVFCLQNEQTNAQKEKTKYIVKIKMTKKTNTNIDEK